MASSRPSSLVPAWRHNSNPSVSSPLHHTFPVMGAVSAPGSPPTQDTPSRAPRSTGIKTRRRGESRSSSAPSALLLPRQRSEATSAVLSDNRRSVKHLTCFWWKDKRTCRFSDEECLYAHYDTGRYTDPPRQVIPGEPAKAGRSLDRALKTLALSHRSSPSLSSMHGVQSLPASRPDTPGLEMPRISTPSPRTISALDDNIFLRTLIEQGTREKAVLVNSIDRLQTENEKLQTEVGALRAQTQQLKLESQQITSEREILRNVVGQYQQRTSSNPYGVIGSNRVSQHFASRLWPQYENASAASREASPAKDTFGH